MREVAFPHLNVFQLHQLLLELVPGGAKKGRSAAQAKALLAAVPARDTIGNGRRDVARLSGGCWRWRLPSLMAPRAFPGVERPAAR